MDTGTRSFRRAFKKGSCRDWPLAIGFSLLSVLVIVRLRIARVLSIDNDPSKLRASLWRPRIRFYHGRRRSGDRHRAHVAAPDTPCHRTARRMDRPNWPVRLRATTSADV